jgi:hypothetical protein
MTVLRFAILTVLMTLGTLLGQWWVIPLLAAGHGIVTRGSGRPTLEAGGAAALAWGGYLGLLAFGGAPVGRFGSDLAQSMGVPGAVPLIATLLFPALVAAPAAYLGAHLRPQGDTAPRRR